MCGPSVCKAIIIYEEKGKKTKVEITDPEGTETRVATKFSKVTSPDGKKTTTKIEF